MQAKPGKFLSSSYLSRYTIFSLFVAIFSGYYSFDRLLSWQTSSFLTEFRFLGMSVCLLFLIVSFRYSNTTRNKTAREFIALPVLILFFYAVVALNATVLGNPDSMSGDITDVIYVALFMVMTLFIFKDRDDLYVFAVIAEVIGLVLFVLVIAGVDNPEVRNSRWAPIGGVITFYRMEFLASCAALYLAGIAKNIRLKIVHLIFAVITSFASLMTLSKAPLVGILAVLILFSIWFLSNKDYTRLVVLWLVFSLSLLLFFTFGGDKFQHRLKSLEAKYQDSIRRPTEKYPDTPLTLSELIDIKKYAGKNINFADLDPKEMEKIKALAAITGDGAPDYKNNLQKFILYNDRLLLLYDRSYRSQLLAYAVHLSSIDLWKGVGAGNYSYVQLNSGGKMTIHKHPHNILVEIFVEYGLIGLSVFGIAFLVTLSFLLRVLMRDTSSIFFIGYALFIFVTSMFSGDLYDFRIFWIISIIILTTFSSPASAPLMPQIFGRTGNKEAA